MNAAHLHLLLNHFPMACLLFGFCIAITGKVQRSETVLRVALGLLVVGGFAAAGAFLTGDPAEDVLKALPTFSEQLVHEHEQAADFGLWACLITAVVAALGLFLSRKKGVTPRGMVIALLVINFWALTVIGRTNYLGGQISHPETRAGAKQPS